VKSATGASLFFQSNRATTSAPAKETLPNL
jgi:hypothetical protein